MVEERRVRVNYIYMEMPEERRALVGHMRNISGEVFVASNIGMGRQD